MRSGAALLLGPALAALLLAGCAERASTSEGRQTRAAGEDASESTAPAPSAPAPAETTTETISVEPVASGPEVSDGRPALAALNIPRLGIHDLRVVPYRGMTDDAPGTAIQNRGRAASPHGPRGGVGPGGVGNYQVTAHRLSSTRAFEFLPRLRRGDEVSVVARGTRYVYRITTTRRTSFRSPPSLREQRAAVPGRPGLRPHRAMITLSTCATIEDHAVGNFWADEFDNPEHRIEKVGVLVKARAV